MSIDFEQANKWVQIFSPNSNLTKFAGTGFLSIKDDFQSKMIRSITAFFIKTLLTYILTLCIIYHLQAQPSPQRIASLAPHITEIIFKLGAGDRLIARTDFCRYPAAANHIESIGGYLNIDFEKLVVLKPDLVLQFPNAEYRRKLESLGFIVEEVSNETVAEILGGIRQVGHLLELEQRANKVCDGIRDTLDLVSTNLYKNLTPVWGLLLVGREQGSLKGLYAAGKKTYLSEIWEMCGGKNVFPEIKQRYFSVNKEDLLKKDVDVILEFHAGWNLNSRERIKEQNVWSVFNNLKAVQDKDIYFLSEDYFVIPGPRISKIAIQFSKIIKSKQMVSK